MDNCCPTRSGITFGTAIVVVVGAKDEVVVGAAAVEVVGATVVTEAVVTVVGAAAVVVGTTQLCLTPLAFRLRRVRRESLRRPPPL